MKGAPPARQGHLALILPPGRDVGEYMKNFNAHCSRRRVLERGGRLISVTLLASSGFPAVLAQEPEGAAQRVDPDNPVARALNYVENAADSEVREDADAYCRNCRFYLDGEGEETAPCQLIMNQLVPAEGWCSGWVAKEA